MTEKKSLLKTIKKRAENGVKGIEIYSYPQKHYLKPVIGLSLKIKIFVCGIYCTKNKCKHNCK